MSLGFFSGDVSMVLLRGANGSGSTHSPYMNEKTIVELPLKNYHYQCNTEHNQNQLPHVSQQEKH